MIWRSQDSKYKVIIVLEIDSSIPFKSAIIKKLRTINSYCLSTWFCMVFRFCLLDVLCVILSLSAWERKGRAGTIRWMVQIRSEAMCLVSRAVSCATNLPFWQCSSQSRLTGFFDVQISGDIWRNVSERSALNLWICFFSLSNDSVLSIFFHKFLCYLE
jgi:hypothetical protein